MEWIDHVILLSSGLIVLSILVGLVSTRFGAPLLLVAMLPVLQMQACPAMLA